MLAKPQRKMNCFCIDFVFLYYIHVTVTHVYSMYIIKFMFAFKKRIKKKNHKKEKWIIVSKNGIKSFWDQATHLTYPGSGKRFPESWWKCFVVWTHRGQYTTLLWRGKRGLDPAVSRTVNNQWLAVILYGWVMYSCGQKFNIHLEKICKILIIWTKSG